MIKVENLSKDYRLGRAAERHESLVGTARRPRPAPRALGPYSPDGLGEGDRDGGPYDPRRGAIAMNRPRFCDAPPTDGRPLNGLADRVEVPSGLPAGHRDRSVKARMRRVLEGDSVYSDADCWSSAGSTNCPAPVGGVPNHSGTRPAGRARPRYNAKTAPTALRMRSQCPPAPSSATS